MRCGLVEKVACPQFLSEKNQTLPDLTILSASNQSPKSFPWEYPLLSKSSYAFRAILCCLSCAWLPFEGFFLESVFDFAIFQPASNIVPSPSLKKPFTLDFYFVASAGIASGAPPFVESSIAGAASPGACGSSASSKISSSSLPIVLAIFLSPSTI